MNKKILFFTILVIGISIVFSVWLFKEETLRLPIIFSQESGLLLEMDIDDLISHSNLIAIGEFTSIPDSQWNTPNGRLPENATSESIWDDRLFIYTEQVFQGNQILKRDPQNREVLVRSFGGQVGIDIMQPSNLEIIYTTNQKYLLFLSYYPDRVDDDTPGYYIATGSYQGVYKITNNLATSHKDEWNLNELIAYIQDSPLSRVDVPNTPETEDIIQKIEESAGIEHACEFDFSAFPSLYINDPRYTVDSEKLDFIRMATDNPSLETAGYLDYKITYHSWWLEGKQKWGEAYTIAHAENRDLSEEEANTLLTSKWGTYTGGWCTPKSSSQLRFISIKVDEDIATVVLGVNDYVRELILVFNGNDWMIAQEKQLYP